MKRTAGAFLLLASLGGGCMSADRVNLKKSQLDYNKATHVREVKDLQGPHGEPVPVAYTPRGMRPTAGATGGSGMMTAGYVAGSNPLPGEIMRANYNKPGCTNCADKGIRQVGGFGHSYPDYGPPKYQGGHGILPVPQMGPPGAVAAVGALPLQMPMAPVNARTSVKFAEPREMKVTWYGPNGWNDTPLTTPVRYNFLQGGIYRLKLSQIANRPELTLYPTLEVLPATPKTSTFLAHTAVPVSFSDDDLEQVAAGNFLVKVIYLPDPQYQDLATVAGPNELVSTRLEPGVDPIVEAQRRGTILLIIRMGNINLEDRNTPAMDAPNPFVGGGMMSPAGPGSMVPPAKNPTPTPNPVTPKGPTTAEPILAPKSPTTEPKRPNTLPLLP